MKAGSSQLPCVSLLHRSSLAVFSPSACVCPAGRHTFQTGESLFLGSLGFLTPPLVLYLTLYGSSFFLQKGNRFPVCMRVCVCVCLHVGVYSMPASGRSSDLFSENGKKIPSYFFKEAGFLFQSSPQGLIGRLALLK